MWPSYEIIVFQVGNENLLDKKTSRRWLINRKCSNRCSWWWLGHFLRVERKGVQVGAWQLCYNHANDLLLLSVRKSSVSWCGTFKGCQISGSGFLEWPRSRGVIWSVDLLDQMWVYHRPCSYSISFPSAFAPPGAIKHFFFRRIIRW